jgi:cell fate regulator YaaT (PSP1 superfamily)
MATVIGVRFREVGRVYHFDPGENEVRKGDRVVVETARGVECGEVIQGRTELPDDQLARPLKMMIRVATAEDLQALENKAKKEAAAFDICETKISEHGLDMKLVGVEYAFDASKIMFHFTADQRVDFRALVRDLAREFRTRIEMRQIGVRDEAKLLGGLGICGRPFCCNLYMGDFHPVSIKMAKEQNLSLNPTKISGTCGRLMCCLKYEEAAYEDALKHMPRPGEFVETPEGRGLVTEINAVSETVRVRLDRRQDASAQTFPLDKLEGRKRRIAPQEEGAAEADSVTEEAPAVTEAPTTAEAEAPVSDEGRIAPQGPKQRGGNWRERHQPKRREPQTPQRSEQTKPQQPVKPQRSERSTQQPRQRPPQVRQPQPPAQPVSPAQGYENVPRYGEVRRAFAPKPPEERPQNERRSAQRQPWQKKRGKPDTDQKPKGDS